MKPQQIDRAVRLSSAMGVSGEEGAVRRIMIESFGTSELIHDKLGSLFMIKRSDSPNAKTLMISAAMDEIGLMIDGIQKDGTLSFVSLEDISPASILHQKCTVYTRDHVPYQGIITNPSTKYMEHADTSIQEGRLCIDTGMTEQEAEEVFRIGDLAVIGEKAERIRDHVLVGRALNNRLMIEAMLEIHEELQDEQLDYNLVVGGIAQSVIGYRGTKTATYVVKPDCSLVLTGFETNASDPAVKRGDGTVVGYYDKGMLPSRRLEHHFMEHHNTARPYLGILGNDGSFIHKTLKGTPSLSVGIPMTNMGTAHVLADLNDVDDLVKSVTAWCRILTSQDIADFQFGVDHVDE